MILTALILLFFIIYNLFEIFNIKIRFNIIYADDELQITNQFKFSNLITDKIKYIDDLIKTDVSKMVNNNLMNEICQYAMSGGKRIRSIIINSLANKNNKISKQSVDHSILFIEYLHASSLIMDDIMDKDIDRRGKQCLHVKYGETYAQMASILLLSLAFVHLSELLKETDKQNEILSVITNDFYKLSEGQFYDITHEKIDSEKLIEYKTGTLFEMSYVLGTHNVETRKYGKIIGELFQIADDFDDMYKDLYKNNANYVNKNGKNKALKKFNELIDQYDYEEIPEISEILDYLRLKL
jgi:geranylgeranyl pyrophosphate synthase